MNSYMLGLDGEFLDDEKDMRDLESEEQHFPAKEEFLPLLEKLEEISRNFKDIKEYQIPSLPDSVKIRNLRDIPTPEVNIDNDGILQELEEIKLLLKESGKVEDELTFIVDNFSSKVTFIGHAKVGSKENENVWKIKRITEEKGETVCEYADGDAKFDNSWLRRDRLTYG